MLSVSILILLKNKNYNLINFCNEFYFTNIIFFQNLFYYNFLLTKFNNDLKHFYNFIIIEFYSLVNFKCDI